MLLALKADVAGASWLTLVNDGAATGYDLLAGADFGSPTWDHAFSGQRGTQGSRPAQGTIANRGITLPLRVVGTSKDDLASKLAAVAQAVNDLRRYGGLVRVRSKSQTYLQYGDVLAANISLPDWNNRLEQNLRAAVGISLICGPYMLGDPMDVVDDFNADSINGGSSSDYTADAGALTNIGVSGGSAVVTANPTTENRLIVSGRYSYGDVEVRLVAQPTSTITNFKAGVVLKRIDASNYLEGYIDDNGTNSRLRLDKVVAGSRTNISSINLASRLTANQRFMVGAKIESNRVLLEYDSTAILTVATDVANGNANPYQLSTAEAAQFGAAAKGGVGWSILGQATGALVEQFTVRPYSYRGAAISTADSFPFQLRGDIPGDAPAACDLWLSSLATPLQRFGIVGWGPYKTRNLLGNGGFEYSATATAPWSVAAVSGITGAASSIAAVTAGAKFGFVFGRVTTPATANVGTTYAVYGRFEIGVTYTFDVWVRSAASTHNARARVGVSGDVSSSTAVALSTTWTKHSVAWTPTATVKLAYVCVEQTAATAGTIDIDGACLYEGTTAPTHGAHAEGEGGYPPLAVIGSADYVALTGSLTATTDANALSGTVMRQASVGGGGASYTLQYLIDPSLHPPDDYAQETIGIEVWGRFLLSSAFTGGVMVILSASTLAGDQVLYTPEFGSSGRSLVVPSSGNSLYQSSRLGSLRLRCAERSRFLLTVQISVGAGTNAQAFGLDSLFLFPTRARVCTPPGKPDSGYPTWMPGAGSKGVKIIRSADLSGILTATFRDFDQSAGSGMIGGAIELPTGAVSMLALTSERVPDGDAYNSSDGMSRMTVHPSVTPRYHWMRAS